MDVRKAVIPAAGLGTRFLPVTKAVPKELLPVIDRPSIQYVIEEAIESGIEHIVLVVSRGKTALQDYFDRHGELEETLRAKGDPAAESLERLWGMCQFSSVRQAEAKGLGHAVLCAAHVVGDDPFAVLLPDDLIMSSTPALGQLIQVAQDRRASVVAVERVPAERISAYGVVGATPVADRLYQANAFVEKPRPEDAPSDLGVVGRYVFTPRIMELLRHTRPGAKGEIQLTDAIAALLREEAVYACQFVGERFDTGNPLGLMEASLAYGLRRPDTSARVRQMMERLLEWERAGQRR